jgi:PDZ domain-containing protein
MRRRALVGSGSAARAGRPLRLIATALLLGAIALASLTVPIPIFYLYLPGPVRDVQRLVHVTHARTYSSEGPLYMTTVNVDLSVTAADIVEAALDPHKAVVLRSEVTGGEPLDVVEREQRAAMDASQQFAREVALEAAGLGQGSGDGARVVGTKKRAPAHDVLQPGDVIVSIDEEPVSTVCDVGSVIGTTEVGDVVELRVRRDGRLETLPVRTIADADNGGLPIIGVSMQTIGYRFESDVEVDFKTGRIAGPSAGLMLTLALYDRVTPEDLTGGRAIAGTGEIDCSGGVGAIGGVVQKVAAAEADGADVFLSPLGNVAEARSAAEHMRVVAVSDFQDALEYLEAPAA